MGSVSFFTMMSITAIPFIVLDARVYSREKHNGAYGSVAFTLTMALRSIVVTLLFAAVASLLLVFLGGIEDFGLYFVALWATLLFAESFAIMCSVITMDYVLGIVVAMSCFAIFMILSGFFIVFATIPWSLKWLAYATPLRYSFRAVLRQEFGSNRMYDINSTFPNGDAVLTFFSVDNVANQNFWTDIFILTSFTCLCFAVVGWVFQRQW